MILNVQSKGTASVDPDTWILLFFSIKYASFFYQNCVLQELFKQNLYFLIKRGRRGP